MELIKMEQLQTEHNQR